MSYNVNLQHIVFRTYRSRPTIPNETKRALFKYIHALCQSEGWYLIRINSHLNHIHILIDIPFSVKPSTVPQKIKSNTSRAFRHHPLLPNFEGWAKKYGSFSASYKERETLINYINNQEEHHRTVSFEDEIKRIFSENGVTDFDDFLIDDDADPC